MPKLPFDSRTREEPESGAPPKRRHAFVTHDEMNAAIAEAHLPVMASLARIEAEAVEARKERLLRKQWEAEQREEQQFDAMREKTKSETDLLKAQAMAISHPTPLQFVPVAIPKIEIEDEEKPHRYNKNHVAVAIISAISLIAVAAIGAWQSQRGSHPEPSPVALPAEHH